MEENNSITSKLPGVDITVNGRMLKVPEWSVQDHIRKTKYVMPLVSTPMANAAAMASEDDESGSLYMAALIKGVASALAEEDLSITIPQLLEGVIYINDNGVPKQATLDNLEKDCGMKFQHILKICVSVIKVNVGPLFDGDLQEMMMGL